MKLKIIYRISDNSYPKPKLIGVDKEICLKNFIDVFHSDNLYILADNCKKDTIDSLLGLTFEETRLGNAGSLLYALRKACELPDKTFVYFSEDDYLHHDNAYKVLLEGLAISDYVSLFDHPDKYSDLYNYGETVKVVRTKSSHWKHTISTCMTFGTRVGILKEDMKIWNDLSLNKKNHPLDHETFIQLKKKGRTLISCIPGMAFHTDLTEQIRLKNAPIDDWALNLAAQYLNQEILKLNNDGKISEEEILKLPVLTQNKKPFEKAIFLGAFIEVAKKRET